MAEASEVILTIGRRKSASARVRMTHGTGKITVNRRAFNDYFTTESIRGFIQQPLVLTSKAGEFDIYATLDGGGMVGQAGALRHGIARALLLASEDYRPILKKAGFLTRDPRMKERKKYGLKAARRAPQFSKR